MTLPHGATSVRSEVDGELADLVEELTRKLQHDPAFDVEAHLGAHPQHAEPLRQLLPTLAGLAALNNSVQSGSASVSPTFMSSHHSAGVLGDFRILREIGRGGMGVVYEAEQISLRRRVALKILPFAAVLDPRHLQRFKNEAQAAAALHHTNIVPVFSVGCERGVHYYAMQYIEGKTLADVVIELRRISCLEQAGDAKHLDRVSEPAQVLLSGGYALGKPAGGDLAPPQVPMPTGPSAAGLKETEHLGGLSTEPSTHRWAQFRSIAELGVKVAEALEHAHEQGVIHRDIKPSNLMVDAHGTVWVTDFGLAHIETDVSLTVSGDLLGTLRYMSPEQALGKRVGIDHRTDIYSLGITLYELLTLQPAFPETERQRLLNQIAIEDPPAPRELNSDISLDLETIVLKAITKSPGDRYQSAREFADDLQRFLEHKPIQARRPTLWDRAGKWTRRHTAFVWSTVTVLVLASIGSAAASLLILRAYHRESQALRAESAAREIAQQQTDLASDRLEAFEHRTYNLQLKEVRSLWRSEPTRAREILDDPIRCPEHLRDFTWGFYRRLTQNRIEVRDQWLLDQILVLRQVSLSPDGRVLATSEGYGLTQDPYVLLWDMQTRQPLARLQGHGRSTVWQTAFSPDGRLVATAGDDAVIKIWDVASGQEQHRLTDHTGPVRSVLFLPDGKTLVSAGNDPAIKLWDTETWQVRSTLLGHRAMVLSLAVAPAGSGQEPFLASAGTDGVIHFWDLKTCETRARLTGHSLPINVVVFSPDGTLLVSGSDDRTIRLWEATTGRSLATLTGHTGGVLSLALSPDGQTLASGSDEPDTSVELWDVAARRERATLDGQVGPVQWLAFSADGSELLSAGGAKFNSVVSWDVSPTNLGDAETPMEWATVRSKSGWILDVEFSPDGKSLATGCSNGIVKFWDTATWEERRSIEAHTDIVSSLAFSPDGTMLATVSPDGELKLWDVQTGEALATLLRNNKATRPRVDFSADGKSLAAAEGRTIHLWDVASCVKKVTLIGHTNAVSDIEFSPTENLLASASADETIRLWDIDRLRERAVLHGHPGGVADLTFSSDGLTLASGGHDQNVKLWDTRTGKLVDTFPGASPHLERMTFSLDGKTLALCNSSTINLWDAMTGDERGVLQGHLSTVMDVAYSRDGKMLVSAGSDDSMKLWVADNRPINDAKVTSFHERAGAYRWYAAFYRSLNDFAEALRFLDMAIALNPFDPWHYRERAYIYAERQQFDEALVDLNKAIELWPNSSPHWRRARLLRDRAYILEALGKYNRATNSLRDAIALEPHGHRNWLELALMHLAHGQVDVYRRDCASMLDGFADGDDPIALGAVSWTIALHPDAVMNFSGPIRLAQKAAASDPQSAQFATALGAILYRSGRFQETVDQLAALVNRQDFASEAVSDFSPAYAWYFLALAHHRLGDSGAALSWYERARDWNEPPVRNREESPRLGAYQKLTLQLLRQQAHALLGLPATQGKPTEK